MIHPRIKLWLREPFCWFCVCMVPLWLGLGTVWFWGQAIGEQVPFLTLGVIESIMTYAVFLTVFCFCAALLIRLERSKRQRVFYILAAAGAVLLVGSALLTWATGSRWWRNVQVQFDGDMRPIGLRMQRSSQSLEVDKAAELSKLHAHSTSFPQFLGPQRDLHVPWIKLNPKATADDFEILWRRPIGEGWSGFSAVDGVAFTMEQNGPHEVVTAYRITDGERLWFHETLRRHETPEGGIGPRSTPTFHDGLLYTLGAVGTLTCLQAHSGEVVWKRELTTDFQIPVTTNLEGTTQRYDVEKSNLNWGRSASPLIVNDKVIVPIGGPTNSGHISLAAFDRMTGDLIWQGGTRPISYGSPTLVTLSNTPMIVVTNESDVSGYDPETGKELWSHARPGSSGGAANTSQPIPIGENRLLLTKEYGLGGKLIEVERGSAREWSTNTVWEKSQVLKTKFTVAAVRGDYAYAISAGVLECVDVRTGERTWRGDRVKHGQLLLTMDHLLVMFEEGHLAVVDADPADYFVRMTKSKVLPGRCWNTLCIYEDRLLARSDQEAICIRLPLVEKLATDLQSQTTRQVSVRQVSSQIQDNQQDHEKRARQAWLEDYEVAAAKHERAPALAALDGLLREYPDEIFAYYQRGCLRCWMGDFAGSVADFDRYVQLRPEVESRMWERGISYYFAEDYEKGAKQFELYQTYHDNDVENSVWRFLCQVKTVGLEQARKELLPIKNDPRVPLMEILKLYRGESTVQQVLDAIERGEPTASELQSRKFYGHYYLGLYLDAIGEGELAKTHFEQAVAVPANSPRVSRYMWDIAKIHFQSRSKEIEKPLQR